MKKLLFIFLLVSMFCSSNVFSEKKLNRIIQVVDCVNSGGVSLELNDSNNDGIYDMAIETLCDGNITKLPIKYCNTSEISDLSTATNVSSGAMICIPTTYHHFSWNESEGKPKVASKPPTKLESNIQYTIFFDDVKSKLFGERTCWSDTLFVQSTGNAKSNYFFDEKLRIQYLGNYSSSLKFHIISDDEGPAFITLADTSDNIIFEIEQFFKHDNAKQSQTENIVTFDKFEINENVYEIKVKTKNSYKSELIIIKMN